MTLCWSFIRSGNSRKEETNVQSSCPDSSVTAGKQNGHMGDRDDDVVRRAREEGRVNILFPGTVTQEGCYRFVSEILKCILYQRQQLPMTYDQLVYSQKKQQASMQVIEPAVHKLLHLFRFFFFFLNVVNLKQTKTVLASRRNTQRAGGLCSRQTSTGASVSRPSRTLRRCCSNWRCSSLSAGSPGCCC